MLNLLFGWKVMRLVCIPSLIISAICAVFIIIVIMLQQSNSNGIGALGGQQDTFYSKNKGKTLESKLRKLTVIAVSVMAVFMILFCVMVFHVQS
jgi:preprotein translocase subunit SecG